MNHAGDVYFDGVIQKDESDNTLAASCVVDSKSGDIILKLVNAGTETKEMKVDLSMFDEILPDAEKFVLSGPADAENTFENPESIVPEMSVFSAAKTFEYVTPAMSLTVLRIKSKNR